MNNYSSLWMDEDLRVLRDAVRSFYAKEFVPNYERWMEQGMVDRDAWNKAGEMGILCASIPEEYGSAGGTFAHDVVIAQELGRAGISGFTSACTALSWPITFSLTALKNRKSGGYRRWSPERLSVP